MDGYKYIAETIRRPYKRIPVKDLVIDKVLSEIKAYPNSIALDADKIARDLGSPKSANMVVLGAALDHLDQQSSRFPYFEPSQTNHLYL